MIPAFTDRTEVRVQFLLDTSDPAETPPQSGDLELGELSSTQNPTQHIVPTLDLQSVATSGKNSVSVWLFVKGLVPFGDSTAPLFYKGRQIETLRFHKSGLNIRPAPEGPLVAQEHKELLLVLENPSGFDYPAVKARVRFQGADVCPVPVSVDCYGGQSEGSDSRLH